MPIDVCSHIAGTVWKVEVAEGDQVRPDQVLVTLESMKMEMTVSAPAAGRVARVVVSAGQSVQQDDVLLTLE